MEEDPTKRPPFCEICHVNLAREQEKVNRSLEKYIDAKVEDYRQSFSGSVESFQTSLSSGKVRMDNFDLAFITRDVRNRWALGILATFCLTALIGAWGSYGQLRYNEGMLAIISEDVKDFKTKTDKINEELIMVKNELNVCSQEIEYLEKNTPYNDRGKEPWTPRN